MLPRRGAFSTIEARADAVPGSPRFSILPPIRRPIFHPARTNAIDIDARYYDAILLSSPVFTPPSREMSLVAMPRTAYMI